MVYMNKQDYDIMNIIYERGFVNQRELAKKSGYSIGKVNATLKELKKEKCINENMELTGKMKKELQLKKPRNAVILAAGYGMRMVPINVEVPKGLLQIKSEPLIERVIKQLHQVEIYEIYIVVGFMKEKYEYLIDKYNVNLIFNKEYVTKNNLHSLNCICEKIGNTYIIPCDVWFKNNPFSNHEWYSWYMVTDQIDERSTVRVNRKQMLVNLKKGQLGNKMIGVSYILINEANLLKRKLKEYSEDRAYDQAYWEEAFLTKSQEKIVAKLANSDEVYEINTYEQLRELDRDSAHLESDAIELISQVFLCEKEEIVNIKALKKGMTNRSFEFECKGKKYIMRIPGEGTDLLLNRKNEYNVYQQLAGKNIADPIIFISPNKGYKITEFINDARVCNKDDKEDVKRCMEYLKKFHDMKLKVTHTYDLFEQIEKYEQLWGNEKSLYIDYESTKSKVYELKPLIDKLPKEIGLTHIDAVYDNFLIKGNDIYLIDWEYAGMQDVHIDIAMFAIYAMYDRKQIDDLIDFYFNKKAEMLIRIKIYCYISICGLLWSNWCEYKRICGVEFGEYSLRQYRYAKEYYKIAMQLLKEEQNVSS